MILTYIITMKFSWRALHLWGIHCIATSEVRMQGNRETENTICMNIYKLLDSVIFCYLQVPVNIIIRCSIDHLIDGIGFCVALDFYDNLGNTLEILNLCGTVDWRKLSKLYLLNKIFLIYIIVRLRWKHIGFTKLVHTQNWGRS